MIDIALATAALMALAIPVVLAVVVVSVQAEDRRGALPHQAPGHIARGVRRLTGLRVSESATASPSRRAMSGRRSA